MWVEGGDIQDELLDRLGGVLAPPEDLALTPSAAELEALALAVAARWPDQAFVASPAPVAASDLDSADGADGADAADSGDSGDAGDHGDNVVRRLHWAGPRTRRLGSRAWRAGSVAAGIVVFSASAAAAANGGVPLPRPVRVVAYNVGLPVDSPALDDTHQHIKDLNEAVKANDKPKAEKTAARLQTDLKKVPASEKKEATPKVEAALKDAAKTGIIPPPPPMTTTTAPPAPTTTTTVPAPASVTTATTAEEKEKDKDKGNDGKDRPNVTTTTGPTTTTTEPEPTTSTTAPETDETPGGTTDPGPGDGHTGAGTGGDPGTTPTTVPPDTTTTTTGPPPEETTTTTTAPEPVTTTTTAPPASAP